MNPNLNNLHSYPFEKLSKLKEGVSTPNEKSSILLSLGEPQLALPDCIRQSILANLDGLTKYPTTKGLLELRRAIGSWLERRFKLPGNSIDAERNVLPVSGTREALFSFAQCVIDPGAAPIVILPNPFYQIYEGAALLAGAEPYYVNCTRDSDYLPEFESIPESIWSRCQLLYICSPGNPTGKVINEPTLKRLIELAARFDFVIAADECYSEIYLDEQSAPPGLLQISNKIGNHRFNRCIVFNSLSKRSNAPGLRSGFVAGDPLLLTKFYQYRTYHGCAMPIPSQYASIAAWNDENHVLANRNAYRGKFAAVTDILSGILEFDQPQASFFLWPRTSIADQEFALKLFETENVTVLPGSYLSRHQHGLNPGLNHVRIALVQPESNCVEAARRIKEFVQLSPYH